MGDMLSDMLLVSQRENEQSVGTHDDSFSGTNSQEGMRTELSDSIVEEDTTTRQQSTIVALSKEQLFDKKAPGVDGQKVTRETIISLQGETRSEKNDTTLSVTVGNAVVLKEQGIPEEKIMDVEADANSNCIPGEDVKFSENSEILQEIPGQRTLDIASGGSNDFMSEKAVNSISDSMSADVSSAESNFENSATNMSSVTDDELEEKSVEDSKENDSNDSPTNTTKISCRSELSFADMSQDSEILGSGGRHQNARKILRIVEQFMEKGEYDTALDWSERGLHSADWVETSGGWLVNGLQLEFCCNIMQLHYLMKMPEKAVDVYESCQPFLYNADPKVAVAMMELGNRCKTELRQARFKR